MFPIKNRLDTTIIQTKINGFADVYSVEDLIPYQESEHGTINVNLYDGIQDTWEQRQTHNNVPVYIPAAIAIDSVISNTQTDRQAVIQYFNNPNSDKRIVIFGHSHEPKIVASENDDNEKCIYANSGTWIDHNPDKTTMNFIVITPQNDDVSSQTLVTLYNFENQKVTKMAEDSLRY